MTWCWQSVNPCNNRQILRLHNYIHQLNIEEFLQFWNHADMLLVACGIHIQLLIFLPLCVIYSPHLWRSSIFYYLCMFHISALCVNQPLSGLYFSMFATRSIHPLGSWYLRIITTNWCIMCYCYHMNIHNNDRNLRHKQKIVDVNYDIIYLS